MRISKKWIKSSLTTSLLVVVVLLASSSFALEKFSNSNIPRLQDPCSVKVKVNGKGHVVVDQSNQPSRRVQLATLPAGCGELVTLTAKPEGPWLFERWEGVEEADSRLPTITVEAEANVSAIFSPRELRYILADVPYYNRNGELVDTIPVYEPLWQPTNQPASELSDTEPPTIELWYGDPQPFGQPGVAQKWYDILGNVSDDHMENVSLEYSVNGDPPLSLSFGGDGSKADGRRLWNQGDFVIDLDRFDLSSGLNTVLITANDSFNSATVEVVVDYEPAPGGWPLPSNVIWDEFGEQIVDLPEVSQIVDGKWEIVEGGVHIKQIGYDRILDVGDINWTSYEALVPFTVHDYDEDIFGDPISGGVALGLVLHWRGHSDTPNVGCVQPKCGWLPVGMASWFGWDKDTGKSKFSMWDNLIPNSEHWKYFPEATSLTLGEKYFWKVQVNNAEGSFGTYRSKTWPQDQPEPTDWLVMPGTDQSQQTGSLLLLAHHVDVTFGNVKLRQLNGDYDNPVISDFEIDAGATEAAVSWKTNEPTTSIISYYDTPGNEMTVSDDTLVTNHRIVLEDLIPETTYAFQIVAEDESGNQAEPASDSFITAPPPVKKFKLTVSVDGPGSVVVEPSKPEYDSGDEVKLTAVPTWPKWFLASWSINDNPAGDENPLTVVITEDTNVEATILRYQFNYLPLVRAD